MDWDLQPTLSGRLVTLVPMSVRHREELLKAARPREIWDYWPLVVGADEDAFDDWFVHAIVAPVAYHFTTVWNATGEAIGSTSFLPYQHDRWVEIGWTWITPAFWGMGANTEAKFLQLQYAFETLECIRVQWDTYADNARSRAALEALGAKLDGVMRNYNVRRADKTIHDSAFYSIIDSEWPTVKERLRARLT